VAHRRTAYGGGRLPMTRPQPGWSVQSAHT
jgi:hypothetical protein